jgi:hypothetical protein
MNRRNTFMTKSEVETVRRAIGLRASIVEKSAPTEMDRSVFAEAVGIAIKESLDEYHAENRAELDRIRREFMELQLVVGELRVAVADYRAELSGGKAMPPWPKRRESADEAFQFAREKSPEVAPAAEPATPNAPAPLRRDLN